MNFAFLRCIFFICLFFSLDADEKITALDFDVLMDLDRYNTYAFFAKDDFDELSYYRRFYLEKIPLLTQQTETEPLKNKIAAKFIKGTKIPKVLHFIWIGPHPFPTNSISNLKAWKKHHPGWKIKFWTDRADHACPMEEMEMHLISEIPFAYLEDFLPLTENWAEKSDLIRYELLYHEGGVYIDHDIDCFHSFENLNTHFDFYAFLEPPHYIPGIPIAVFATNGLIGANKSHPILKRTMEEVKACWEKAEKKYPGVKQTFARVINRTFSSFIRATKACLEDKTLDNIVLPAAFLYPPPQLSKNEFDERVKNHLCFGSHSYAGTWIPKNSSYK